MNVDLLEIFQSTLDKSFVRELSTQLGETELSTHAALRCAGPLLVTGLMQRVTTPGGASEVFRQITDGQIDPGAAGKLQGVLASRDTRESLLRLGQSLDQKVFGARTAAVTHALAESSGLRTSSARTVLSLTAPVLFGLLKKHATNNDLDATTLGILLLRQQHSVGISGLDHRVAGALGFGSVAEMLAALPGTPSVLRSSEKSVQRMSERPWLPWGAAAAIGIFGVVFLVNRTAEQQELPRGAVKIAEVTPAQMEAPRAERTQARETLVEPASGAAGDSAAPLDSRESARDRTRVSRSFEEASRAVSDDADAKTPDR
jgi:Bacterial protein of unknown function (DUF937)